MKTVFDLSRDEIVALTDEETGRIKRAVIKLN